MYDEPMALSPRQFPLFMTGVEIQNSVTHSIDQREGESLSDMWNRKAVEAKRPATEGSTVPDSPQHGAGVYDSLKQSGWQSPSSEIWLTHNNDQVRMGAGHHRVAAAAALEREEGKQVFIPIEHSYY